MNIFIKYFNSVGQTTLNFPGRCRHLYPPLIYFRAYGEASRPGDFTTRVYSKETPCKPLLPATAALSVSTWFNTPAPVILEDLKGKAVVLAAYPAGFDVTFPVGVDAYEDGTSTPVTMRALGLRGTPSILLLDRQGEVRTHLFGAPDELSLGLQLGNLVAETSGKQRSGPVPASGTVPQSAACDEDGCRLPATDR